MAAQRKDSLSSVDLDELTLDVPNPRFNPVVPQGKPSKKASKKKTPSDKSSKKTLNDEPFQQALSDKPLLAQAKLHHRTTPEWTKQLILASKAYKQYGWRKSYRAMRRFAYTFGPFESKTEFAYAFADVDVPSRQLRQEYRDLAIEKAREAVAGMQEDKVPKEWWQAVEQRLH